MTATCRGGGDYTLSPNHDIDWFAKCGHCWNGVEFDGEVGTHESLQEAEECWRARFPTEARKWDEGLTA